jgi:hypothetical protein
MASQRSQQPSMSECVKVPAPDALEPPGASTGVRAVSVVSVGIIDRVERGCPIRRVASTHRCTPQHVALTRPVIRHGVSSFLRGCKCVRQPPPTRDFGPNLQEVDRETSRLAARALGFILFSRPFVVSIFCMTCRRHRRN